MRLSLITVLFACQAAAQERIGRAIYDPAAGQAPAPTPVPLVLGIDHIPVVVEDLEKAEADFRAMGFVIKPGRVHADGIRNAHIKFPDGAEIELITASAAVDELTSEYRAKMKTGEGPVYFGLYAPDQAAVLARFQTLGIKAQDDDGMLGFPSTSPLHPLFLGGRNKASTDRPEHFAHANSAKSLSGLWVRDSPQLRELLKGLASAAYAHGCLRHHRRLEWNSRHASRRKPVSRSFRHNHRHRRASGRAKADRCRNLTR